MSKPACAPAAAPAGRAARRRPRIRPGTAQAPRSPKTPASRDTLLRAARRPGVAAAAVRRPRDARSTAVWPSSPIRRLQRAVERDVECRCPTTTCVGPADFRAHLDEDAAELALRRHQVVGPLQLHAGNAAPRQRAQRGDADGEAQRADLRGEGIEAPRTRRGRSRRPVARASCVRAVRGRRSGIRRSGSRNCPGRRCAAFEQHGCWSRRRDPAHSPVAQPRRDGRREQRAHAPQRRADSRAVRAGSRWRGTASIAVPSSRSAPTAFQMAARVTPRLRGQRGAGDEAPRACYSSARSVASACSTCIGERHARGTSASMQRTLPPPRVSIVGMRRRRAACSSAAWICACCARVQARRSRGRHREPACGVRRLRSRACCRRTAVRAPASRVPSRSRDPVHDSAQSRDHESRCVGVDPVEADAADARCRSTAARWCGRRARHPASARRRPPGRSPSAAPIRAPGLVGARRAAGIGDARCAIEHEAAGALEEPTAAFFADEVEAAALDEAEFALSPRRSLPRAARACGSGCASDTAPPCRPHGS